MEKANIYGKIFSCLPFEIFVSIQGSIKGTGTFLRDSLWDPKLWRGFVTLGESKWGQRMKWN